MDANLFRNVVQEIKKYANVVLNGQAGETNSTILEDIDQIYPGSPTVTQRPVIHPYGYAARAITGVLSVNLRNGSDPGARYVVGHRDVARPMDLNQGEAAVYSSAFFQLRVANDHITIGQSADNTDAGFAANSFIEIDKGNITVMHKSGAMIVITSDGSVTVTGTSKVSLMGTEIDLGGSSASAVLGEALLMWLNTHTHTTTSPGSPTSPPIVPPPETILSTVVKLS